MSNQVYPNDPGQPIPGVVMQYPGAQPGGGGPVMAQPAGAVSLPMGASGCPPGLEPLLRLNQLMVRQKVEMFEALVGYETNNRYEVLAANGEKLFIAAEDTCCCSRCCCGSERGFEIQLMNILGQEIIHLNAPCRCSSCWCPCCLKTIEVSLANGEVIGHVHQSWSCIKPKFRIEDANGDTILTLEGPWFPSCELCGEQVFQVYGSDGETKCGMVTKEWSGLAKEFFTDADNFGVTFPVDLDVRVKATLMAAVFLIDFMFYETDENKGPAGNVGLE